MKNEPKTKGIRQRWVGFLQWAVGNVQGLPEAGGREGRVERVSFF